MNSQLQRMIDIQSLSNLIINAIFNRQKVVIFRNVHVHICTKKYEFHLREFRNERRQWKATKELQKIAKEEAEKCFDVMEW